LTRPLVPVAADAPAAPETLSSLDASAAARGDLEALEVELLIEGVRRRWGYDFTHYSRASVRRRLEQARREAGLDSLTRLLDRLIRDELLFDRFLKTMSVTVTEMFRDPAFFRMLRETVVPALKTFPFVKIWHAGCATGEEAYSLALLHEENFLGRARIYATDFNKHSLNVARQGVYPQERMQAYVANYLASAGARDFSEYYTAGYGFAKMRHFLKDRITFSYHNLVTDGVFGEMNLISCRNVLIYFDKVLQERVLTLFADSLRHGGFLCLGGKETLSFSNVKRLFESVDKRQKIFKKHAVAHV